MKKPSLGEFCWNELITGNVPSAKEFYGNVFDWSFHDHDMGDMKYTMIKKEGNEFGGIWAIPKSKEQEISPHWLSYILVDDIAKYVDKAQKQGAVILKPATKMGEMGILAILKDPTGAHFALWQPLSISS